MRLTFFFKIKSRFLNQFQMYFICGATECGLEGTHTGEFLGIPPTGKSGKINDFTLLRIANNQIVEWWYECN